MLVSAIPKYTVTGVIHQMQARWTEFLEFQHVKARELNHQLQGVCFFYHEEFLIVTYCFYLQKSHIG